MPSFESAPQAPQSKDPVLAKLEGELAKAREHLTRANADMEKAREEHGEEGWAQLQQAGDTRYTSLELAVGSAHDKTEELEREIAARQQELAERG